MKKILLITVILLTGLNASLTLSKNGTDTKLMTKKGSEQIELFSKACNSGDAKGCFKLGYIYNTGKGVEKDYIKARKYYEISCNAGYARACTRLGLLYGEGKGVKKDINKAIIFFKKACEGGHADGCMVYNAFNKKK